MAFLYIIFSLFILQTVSSQYYGPPAPYSPYNYYYSSNYYYPPPQSPTFVPTLAPTPTPASPIFFPSLSPTYSNALQIPPKSPPKRSVEIPNPKCSPPTASAYFLSTPKEKIKASVISTEEVIPPTKYICPLCNGFADIPPNPKIPPPPPIGSPVLPGILDKIPTILEDLKTKDPCSCLLSRTAHKSDIYEKHKLPKNLSFDQELLEGFLTGLGL